MWAIEARTSSSSRRVHLVARSSFSSLTFVWPLFFPLVPCFFCLSLNNVWLGEEVEKEKERTLFWIFFSTIVECCYFFAFSYFLFNDILHWIHWHNANARNADQKKCIQNWTFFYIFLCFSLKSCKNIFSIYTLMRNAYFIYISYS